MHTCIQINIIHSLSVLILDVAKSVLLSNNASTLVSGSAYQVIYIIIQKIKEKHREPTDRHENCGELQKYLKDKENKKQKE